ncbi:dethiobiotin synthase [Desulfatibacillum aliphaticivorans]|uniref:dethiobiotin synthase n=1 Tax=Desulfatibacillum aliphaticivorans TaxID=218208 RepID=UPI0003F65F88|nr:dethiobiotin synthase [Desulfatibacillum aliphaticivorans]
MKISKTNALKSRADLNYMAKNNFPDRVFITGTDSGVGKTTVAAILMAGLPNSGYWKPLQSGAEELTDSQWICKVTGLSETRFYPETYRLKAPLPPHASAAMENVTIDLNQFWVPYLGSLERLIVEGVGGVMVPLNENHFMLDLMSRLNYPVILVCKNGRGAINNTLLTLEQLRNQGLNILGVVLNGPSVASNRTAIERYGKVRIMAELPVLEQVNPKTLAQAYEDYFTLE